MHSKILACVCLAAILSAVGIAQTGTEAKGNLDAVTSWIDRATLANDSIAWANDLMKADAEAEKLERDKPGECCGLRCVRIGTFELNYRFDSLAKREIYQHDLLQDIVVTQEGYPVGAEALARLLPTGCGTLSSQWIPLFRTVLSILEQKSWRKVADVRLVEIRGEAYETWWSLSKMAPDDVLVTDARMNPADFVEGASLARVRAIEAYMELTKAHKANGQVARRLADLTANHDTQMRKWVCYSD